MTFEELKNQTAYYLDDLNFGYFTDTQVSRWINNAHKEAQKILLQAGQNFFLKWVQTDLIINQADYALPDDFAKLHRLECLISGTPPNEVLYPLLPITLNQQDLVQNTSGRPQCYFIWKNKLSLKPYPDQEYVLRMHYSPVVQDMVNPQDEPQIPESYHEYLAVLAAIDGMIKDGRDISQLVAKREHYEKMFKQDINERQQDTTRNVVQTGDSYSYGSYW